MAKSKGDLPPIDSNLTTLKREIKEAVDEINKLTGERESENAAKAEIIERLEAKGINRHALRMAMRYAKMDERQRRNFDLAYEIVREAIGEPLQGDLLRRAAE